MSFQNDIKPYFETGDFPTQSQFYEMFSKLRWSDEALAITDITGLQTILNGLATPVEIFTVMGGTQGYTIPQGYVLETILINPVADCSCAADTLGAVDPGDIMASEDVTAANGAVWVIHKWAKNAPIDIIVYGMPDNSKIHFIKRKVIL